MHMRHQSIRFIATLIIVLTTNKLSGDTPGEITHNIKSSPVLNALPCSTHDTQILEFFETTLQTGKNLSWFKRLLFQNFPDQSLLNWIRPLAEKNGYEFVTQDVSLLAHELEDGFRHGNGPETLRQLFKETIAKANASGRPVIMHFSNLESLLPRENYTQRSRATSLQFITTFMDSSQIIVIGEIKDFRQLPDIVRNRTSSHGYFVSK